MLCGSQLCGWTRHGGSLLHSALRRVNPVCGSPASAEESHLTRSLFGQIFGRIERLTWVVHRGGGGPGHIKWQAVFDQSLVAFSTRAFRLTIMTPLMSLAKYGDGGAPGPEARGHGERRMASRVAVRSARRGERAVAGWLPSLPPPPGDGGSREARPSGRRRTGEPFRREPCSPAPAGRRPISRDSLD